VANIDVTGDGVADSAAALAAVGITPAEQAQLALLYPTPTSLWRVPIPHFSQPWDFNWPFAPPPGAVPPSNPPPGPPPVPPSTCGGAGDVGGSSGGGSGGSSGGGLNDNSSSPNSSRIECQNGILHETVPVAGTPFSLNYASDRVAGYDALNHLLIPISGATVPSSVVGISLEVDIAGRSFTASFPPSPNLSTTFDWDGQDVLGRTLQGGQLATVSVGYAYQGVYLTPSENPNGAEYNALFGHFSYYGTPATGDPARQQVTLIQRSTVPLGHWDNEALALGGWNLSAHAVYEPSVKTLHFGDGTNVVPAFVPGIIQTAQLISLVGAITAAPDGTLYVGSQSCVYSVSPSGALAPFAGQCGGAGYGFSGDGGPATSAQLDLVGDLAVGPDGSVYIADFENNRVRRVSPSGIISTFAGGGTLGAGNPATQVGLGHVGSVTVAPDGDVYLIDNGQFMRKVTPDGILSTVAGTGPTCCSTGTGGPASAAALKEPGNVRVAPDGGVMAALSRSLSA
jgi:hypothetical protein